MTVYSSNSPLRYTRLRRMYVRKALVAVLLGLLTNASCYNTQPPRKLNLPGIVLWAWEHPENLTFLKSETTGVAFLAGTAVIANNGSVFFRLRTQALELPPHIALLPVVRIESPLQHAPVQTEALLAGLRTVAQLPDIRGLQIDFDARASERYFYRKLLATLSAQTVKPVSVTALTSWCDGDRWLDRESIAEAVPMFFRMGRAASRDATLKSPICLSSIGLSTDEPWPRNRPASLKRIYLFSPHPWTQQDYSLALARIENWK